MNPKRLLDLWRRYRHPRLADLIDRVGAEPAAPWPLRWREARDILERLQKRPPDPRTAQILIEQREKLRYASKASVWLWRSIYEELDRLQDVRVLPRLRVCAGKVLPPPIRYWLKEGDQAVIATLAARKIPDLPNKVLALVERLEAEFAGDAQRAQKRAHGEADYLARIYADPDDLPLREVYGDWLSERGDPRSELIAIQRAHANGRETKASLRLERALLAKHGADWAGPLDPWFAKKGRVFENGFLTGGTLNWIGVLLWRDNAKAAAGEPAWSTIRRLNLASPDHPIPQILAGLPRLRGLYGVPAGLVPRLARGPLRKLAELGIGSGDHPRLASAIASLPALCTLALPNSSKLRGSPKLRALELRDAAAPFAARPRSP